MKQLKFQKGVEKDYKIRNFAIFKNFACKIKKIFYTYINNKHILTEGG